MDSVKKLLKGKPNPYQSASYLTLEPVEGTKFIGKTKEDFCNFDYILQAF